MEPYDEWIVGFQGQLLWECRWRRMSLKWCQEFTAISASYWWTSISKTHLAAFVYHCWSDAKQRRSCSEMLASLEVIIVTCRVLVQRLLTIIILHGDRRHQPDACETAVVCPRAAYVDGHSTSTTYLWRHCSILYGECFFGVIPRSRRCICNTPRWSHKSGWRTIVWLTKVLYLALWSASIWVRSNNKQRWQGEFSNSGPSIWR